MVAWSELFPNGRHLYYEGHHPEGFVHEMILRHKFDPRTTNPNWGKYVEYEGSSWHDYSFHCPADLLDKIYGNGLYPLGS